MDLMSLCAADECQLRNRRSSCVGTRRKRKRTRAYIGHEPPTQGDQDQPVEITQFRFHEAARAAKRFSASAGYGGPCSKTNRVYVDSRFVQIEVEPSQFGGWASHRRLTLVLSVCEGIHGAHLPRPASGAGEHFFTAFQDEEIYLMPSKAPHRLEGPVAVLELFASILAPPLNALISASRDRR